MLACATTHALVGLDPRQVEVEAHLRGGLPAFAIVGLADRAVQEAKERVVSAVRSAELFWPDGRVRRVGGVLAVAEGALRAGLTELLCPSDACGEAALAGIEPIPVRHLADAARYLRGELELEPYVPTNGRPVARDG